MRDEWEALQQRLRHFVQGNILDLEMALGTAARLAAEAAAAALDGDGGDKGLIAAAEIEMYYYLIGV
jgi:hypothetical protein